MKKYKFVLFLTVIIAVFFVLSWFVYDGIDIFFGMIFTPASEKEVKVEPTQTPSKKTQRTKYTTKETKSVVEKKDDTTPPDTRYITSKKTEGRQNFFERFIIKIFPEQLDYVLNPYTFFLLLVLSVLPIIGIFIYMVIYYLR
ncbi:MAG: hypothetical protein K9M99_10855 [Candidatus Cloacimonetes bacterium]|nr:hypothetical protein [Candidatus Cloacimonadota bacterium]